MNKIIGFIGSGNMGSAMVGGILRANLVDGNNIIVADASEVSLAVMKNTHNVRTTTDNVSVASEADILILAVKPQIYPSVCEQIKKDLKQGCVVISIAAGQSLAFLESLLSKKTKIIRAMPNTPAMVGEGMAALCANGEVSAEEMQTALGIFQSFGKANEVPEKWMDAVTGVSGSSPAYVYLFIEALADGAVAAGMPRDMAYTFAAQSVLGAAKMVLETGEHPALLKDKVCSPGGTTIEAVAALEENGMRHAVLAAVQACVDKSKQMTK